MLSPTARGPFDSLIFYQDLSLEPGDFTLFGWWMVDGGWWVVGGGPLFGSLNLFIIISYIV